MKEKILSILSDMRPDIEFETEEGLISDGLLESFDLIQLIATLENEFGISQRKTSILWIELFH